MLNKPFIFTLIFFGLGAIFIANYRMMIVIEPNIPSMWKIGETKFPAEGKKKAFSLFKLQPSYLKGKACNIDGKPIKNMSLYLTTLDGSYTSTNYESAPRSDNEGNYIFEIPASYLPNAFNVTKLYEIGYVAGFPPNAINLHQKVYINRSETTYMDIMIDELPRTRAWWHFKYNTGKCNSPWLF
jgi:hypothetical protein